MIAGDDLPLMSLSAQALAAFSHCFLLYFIFITPELPQDFGFLNESASHKALWRFPPLSAYLHLYNTAVPYYTSFSIGYQVGLL